MKNRAIAVACVLVVAWTAGLCAAAGLEGVRVLTPSPRTFERIELALRPDRTPDNPFDPNQAELLVEVVAPSGRKFAAPGFWFQDFRRSIANPEARDNDRIERLEPVGAPEWRVRFASGETGVHRAALVLRDGRGERRSEEYRIDVQPGADRGYVRISPRNGHYLEDESGRLVFPIGENLCMYQRKEGTYYYDRLLEKLTSAGANYVRLWQEYYVPGDLSKRAAPGDGDFTGFPLETTVTGLGRYDLASAWRLDYVADQCERLNVYWQLASEMVVWWERQLPHRWKRNPYNAANGGPCQKPADYLTNARAREFVRRRLRYNVARWGWSPHLAAWELWNEVDNLDGFDPSANADWHREMGAYVKQVDPWHHLVTTSWRDRQMFALPEIDIVQGHSYFGPEYDAAQYSIEDTEHLMRGFGKPFFFGEQGIEGPVSVDPEGKHFHDTVWATALSGAAGTGLYWWWHNYIEPYNLYRHYAPLAKFLRRVDLPAHEWKAPALSRPNLPVSLNVYGLVAADRALLWIHDPLAWRVVDQKPVQGPHQSSASANIVGLDAGDYDIEWWNTSTGEILLRIGFLHHQQIIWNKGRTVLTRTHYWFQHEPCWYVRKKNAPWFGKAGQNSTIWDSASPKFIMGGSDEEKFDHPTQKPVDLMRRPILNHLRRGELVYDPFLGSGTTLAAAELTERACYGLELDPKYVDVIVQRWQSLTGKRATIEADGRTFEEIAKERRSETA